MTATSRASIYDHPRSKSAQADQRAWQKRPTGDAAEQRAAERDRNEIYSHVSSRQHRADQAADRRGTAGNRVAELRMAHRRQVVELAERHRAEGHALHTKHSRDRSRDPHMAAGKKPSPDLLDKERRETLALSRRHESERSKLAQRHLHEMNVTAAAAYQ
jgi:hypothetical protein